MTERDKLIQLLSVIMEKLSILQEIEKQFPGIDECFLYDLNGWDGCNSVVLRHWIFDVKYMYVNLKNYRDCNLTSTRKLTLAAYMRDANKLYEIRTSKLSQSLRKGVSK